MVDKQVIEDAFVFVAALVGMGCFTGIVTTWLKRRAPKQVQAPVMARLDEIAERLGRLDNAIDTISIEVERISEGQRFTTKLLAERPANAALPDRSRPGGSTTPH